MLKAWKALLSSRKFWVGSLTVSAMISAVFMRSKGLIEHDELIPTIIALTSTGLGTIGSIAWEDAATKKTSKSDG